jgi:hypothetical protein
MPADRGLHLQDAKMLPGRPFYRHKKACVCRLFALQRRGALFAFFRVRLCRNDIARLYNHACDRLVRGKGTAAVNVLALVIALFGRFA